MVGTWNATSPDGTKSVKDNNTIIQNNTTYTKANLNLDHYWGDNTDDDGRHRFVQSPKSETAGTPVDPTPLGTGMDGVSYFKQNKSATLPDFQAVLPYFKDDASTPGVMEMLGIRACALFEGRSTAGAATIKYSHNVTSVTRGTLGQYIVAYTSNLPSNNYLVLAGCVIGVVGPLAGLAGIESNTTLANVKSTSALTIRTQNGGSAGDSQDPFQGWFICFGG